MNLEALGLTGLFAAGLVGALLFTIYPGYLWWVEGVVAIQCGHPASKIIGYLVPVFGQERGFGVRFPL